MFNLYNFRKKVYFGSQWNILITFKALIQIAYLRTNMIFGWNVILHFWLD